MTTKDLIFEKIIIRKVIKIMKQTKLILMLSLTLCGTSALAQSSHTRPDSFFANPNLPAGVVAANQSFLNGNFAQLPNDIKAALMQNSSTSVTRSLLGLYDRAYLTHGNRALTPEWKLPEEITWMSVMSRTSSRPEKETLRHSISFSLNYKVDSEIEQIRIVKHPNNVIIDRQKKIGYFEVTPPGEEPDFNLWGQSDRGVGENPSGLYHFEIKVKGKETMQGWFVLSHMNASTSPKMKNISVNQVLTQAQPKIEWNDYKSPEFQGFESRKTTLAIIDAEKDKEVYVNSMNPIDGTSHVVRKAIPNGKYLFKIVSRERHQFGQLQLSRESETAFPISFKY